LRIELLQRLGGARRLRAFAAQREALAAAGDRDVERGLDLAQILVECAAQVGQCLLLTGDSSSSMARLLGGECVQLS
jgi:hypothetical protein